MYDVLAFEDNQTTQSTGRLDIVVIPSVVPTHGVDGKLQPVPTQSE